MKDIKRKIIFLLILAGAGISLFLLSLSIRSETTQKKEEIQTAEIWNQKSHRIHDAVLYQKLSSGDQFSLERIAEKAGEKGIYIEKIEEKEPLMQGIWTIRRIQISGESSFYRILDFFDIIQDETMWKSLEFHRLERKNNKLFFEGEIQTFYHRGANEKEKYRPDRAYGHREEPGRQTAG